jgi:hypothetical protein
MVLLNDGGACGLDVLRLSKAESEWLLLRLLVTKIRSSLSSGATTGDS